MIGGLALAVIAVLYGLVLGDLLRAWIGIARPLRIVITAILVTVGYFMLQKGSQPMPEQAVEEAQLTAEALRDAE